VAIGHSGEFFANVGDSAGLRQMLAILAIKDGAQHALVLSVGLAKVEARHTESSSVKSPKD
jgi:hypothetical protein